MAGVDSTVRCYWLSAGDARHFWPVILQETGPNTGELTVEWAPDPNPKDKTSLGPFVVRPDELLEWNDVAKVILTNPARNAYNLLLTNHSTVEDVLQGQKRVRPPTTFLDSSPSNKKAGGKPSPAKPSPTKKSKKVNTLPFIFPPTHPPRCSHA